MMRIAVITSSYPRYRGDGTAPFVKSICEHLAIMGHEIEVVAPYDTEVKETESNTIPVHRFHYIWPTKLHIMGHGRSLSADVKLHPLAILLLPLFLTAGFFALLRVTHKQKTQIIHVHWVVPNGLIAAWVATIQRIPFVISLHGSDIYIAKKNRLFRIIAQWIFSKAAGVTACSQELYNAAKTLGANENTQLIAWGADPDLFNPQRRSIQTRIAMGWGQNDVIIFSLGRMVYKKGFGKLLDALPYILRNNPNVRVILGGDGPLKQQIYEQAKKLGLTKQFSLIGRVRWDVVPDLLAEADIFVLPSIRDEFGNVDGLPTVLLEAMASSTAVIASDIGGTSMVINDQENGLLTPPGDVKSLEEALVLLVNNPDKRRSLGFAARQAVVQQFNWLSVANKMEKFFERAIWQHYNHPRLGTIYRAAILQNLPKPSQNARVLDVGCYDAYWLTTLDNNLRIGVDADPKTGAPGILFVRANGLHLPFSAQAFDFVYASDIIEHIQDDRAFAQSLTRVIAPGGTLILSTPSKFIRLYPPFLTNWISRKWGHKFRLGYTVNELSSFFENNLDTSLSTWNAPGYRLFYLPLRLFSVFFPRFARRVLDNIARWDANHLNGNQGFLILEAHRPTNVHTPVTPVKYDA